MKPDFTIHNGDCLEMLKAMPDNYVDLVVTEPPYEIATSGAGIYELATRRCEEAYND